MTKKFLGAILAFSLLGIAPAFPQQQTGGIPSYGSTPVLSACGTGPTIGGVGTANSNWGTIVEGTTATGCTLTWTPARQTIPVCIISFRTSGLPVTAVTTVSITALTWTNASGQGTFDYICIGP